MTACLLVLSQYLVLSASCYFWGCLVEFLAPKCVPTRFRLFWKVILGACAGVIFLTNFVYFNIPLRYGAWIAFLLALAGFGTLTQKKTEVEKNPVFVRDNWLLVGVLAAIITAHSFPLFHQGPSRYYAGGWIDNYLYVSGSQFLIGHPRDDAIDLAKTNAWVADLTTDDYLFYERLGYAPWISYSAVLLRTDTKTSYGTASIFFLGLVAASLFVALRMLSVPQKWSVLGGLWLGVCPGIVNLHFQDFFSQISILFVIPSLVALVWIYHNEIELSWLSLSLLMGYVLCSYPEVYAFLAVLIALAFAAVSLSPVQVKLKTLGVIFLVSVAVNLLWFPRGFPLLISQLNLAWDDVPFATVFAPNAGSWVGWKNYFWPAFSGAHPALYQILNAIGLATSVLILPLLLVSILFRPSRKSRLFATILVFPLAIGVGLLMTNFFRIYAFYKITTTFLPLVILLATVSLAKFDLRFRTPLLSLSFLLLFFLPAVLSCLFEWKGLWDNHGSLGEINSIPMQQTYTQLEGMHGADVYFKKLNPLTFHWLLYHGRHSKIYLNQTMPGWTSESARLFYPRENDSLPAANVFDISSIQN